VHPWSRCRGWRRPAPTPFNTWDSSKRKGLSVPMRPLN